MTDLPLACILDEFDSRARAYSQQIWLTEHQGPAWLAAGIAGAVAAIAWRSRER